MLMSFQVQHSDSMQFDSLFSAKILIYRFNGLGTVILSLISENPRLMLELILFFC